MPVEPQNVSDEVHRIVSRCDICVVDLDECIYPRFTQTTLGALLLARSFHPRNLILMPRLMAGAAYITATRLLQIFGRTPANIGLMSSFSRIMKGVPIALMEGCAAKLPSMGPREWRGALGAVASAMPVYLLTFSIEPIARAYAGVRDGGGGAIFSGYRGTPIEARDGLFRKCLFGRDPFTPGAKAGELSRILGETGRERPLIIGHGEDEAAMCVMADEMGGGSIAICRPGRGSLPGASIRVSSWRAISAALKGRMWNV